MTALALLLTLMLAPVVTAVPSVGGPPQPAPANPIGTAVLGFKERVDRYVKLHNEAESKVPKLVETNDPAKVTDREAALGAMIKSLRATAKEGDVFGADFMTVLEREVRKDFRDRPAADRKALIHELPAKMKIAVNMTYPVDLPLATFPARLLQKLPALPPELEYRLVGHHIVLRDVTANVVVDVARNIVPTIPS
jgi:hypothetical protein